jgi:SAM-dependent methyltransferase
MDLTIITPTTGNPLLERCMRSVVDNGLDHRHWIVWDGIKKVRQVNTHRQSLLYLPENTGCDRFGTVTYFGHRVYSAMSFVVNTKWIYFLDEDNWLKPDFATTIKDAIESASPETNFITFHRDIYHPETNDLIGTDNFESVPKNKFADTGCVIWRTRFYADHIAKFALQRTRQDLAMYRHALTLSEPLHLEKSLLNYTSPMRNVEFFTKGIKRFDQMHLGGWFEQGDANTFMPDVWGDLINRAYPDIDAVVDIGCGAGHNLEWFMNHLDDAFGIEGDPMAIKVAKERNSKIQIEQHDYTIGSFFWDGFYETKPIRHDLAICTEFAEHIHAVYEENWLSDLAHFKYVLFSFALPGQGGHHHVNEQPEEYWIDRFISKGFIVDWGFTKKHRDPNATWGRNTLMLFVNTRTQ